MIVWLASWPRSGNTLCRLIMEQSLGIKTYSEYREPGTIKIFGQDEYDFACKLHDGAPQSYHDLYNDQKKGYVLKTHGIIWDSSKVIFLHRDGRDAIASMAKFKSLHVREAMYGMSYEYPDWSRLYQGWDPLRRPNTLVIRYSEMLADPDNTAKQIGEFLGHPVVRKFDNPQADCIKAWPKCFNETPTQWRSMFSTEDERLFWQLHGQVMDELQYGRKEAA